MSDGVIDPSAIPIPQVNPEDLRTAGDALKNDGTEIQGVGNDIKSEWDRLDGIYIAPESGVLLSALNQVPTKGDEFNTAVAVVGGALLTFADRAEEIKGRLETLKADAQEFRDEIAGDDDWREDEDKVNRHNDLNNDVLAALNDYMAAERDCANEITRHFGGTTFVATDPGGETLLGPNQQAYGFTEAPRDIETPWATPQQHDAPWYEDVWNGVADFGVGIAEDLGAMVGLYGEDGWGVSSWSEWGSNLKDNWGDTLAGLGSLVGLYGENGWGVGSFGEWWGNFSSGWTEFAHAIVPWREWGDRPGYVITQSALNIGSMFLGGAGVFKALARGSRAVGGGGDNPDAPDTDSPDTPSRIDADSMPGLDGLGDRPSTTGLQEALDGLEIDPSRLEGLDNALDDAAGFADRTSPVDPAGNDIPGGGGTSPQGGFQPTALNSTYDAPDTTPALDVDTPARLTGDFETPADTTGSGTTTPVETTGPPPRGGLGDSPDLDTTPDPDTAPGDRPTPLGDTDTPDTDPIDTGADPDPDTSRGDDDSDGSGDQDDTTPYERPRPRLGGSDGLGGVPGDPYADVPPAGDLSRDEVLRIAHDSSRQEPGPGYIDETNFSFNPRVDRGYIDELLRWHDDEGNTFLEAPESELAETQYAEIRARTDDTEQIAQNTGVDQAWLDRIKTHLFYTEHDGALGPNVWKRGLFTPMISIGRLWTEATNGTLDRTSLTEFLRLVKHEGVELRLMEEGLPYRPANPEYYRIDLSQNPSPEHRGAHDLAPSDRGADPYRLFDRVGVERPDFFIADDLSNLEDMVQYILGEIGR